MVWIYFSFFRPSDFVSIWEVPNFGPEWGRWAVISGTCKCITSITWSLMIFDTGDIWWHLVNSGLPDTSQGALSQPHPFLPRGTHELVMGMTLDEAENSLALDRPGGLSMEQWRQTAITQELVERMVLHGSPWFSMVLHGSPWFSMVLHLGWTCFDKKWQEMTRNDKTWEIETTDTTGILVAKVMSWWSTTGFFWAGSYFGGIVQWLENWRARRTIRRWQRRAK